jgi:hypothetical protein
VNTRIAKTPRGNRTRERQLQCPPRCRHSRALDASAAAAAPSPIRATARGKRVGTTRGMHRGMRASSWASLAVDRSEPRELPRAWRRPKGCDVQVSVNSHLDLARSRLKVIAMRAVVTPFTRIYSHSTWAAVDLTMCAKPMAQRDGQTHTRPHALTTHASCLR